MNPIVIKLGATWIWTSYVKPITDKFANEIKIQWEKFDWDKAAEAYRQKVNALYGTLRFLGQTEPVSLEGIFTDVYILNKPSAFRRFDVQQLMEDDSPLHEAERKNGLEVVKQISNNRLFILGKPGAGKTTFLKYIALQAVQGKLHKIPIFVSLKEWSDSGLELMPFLVEQFAICNFPNAQSFIEHILTIGDAIVLFDGLDEVRQEEEQRAQLITVLNNFSKQYLSCQCLITCRVAATDYSFEQFTYMEVADFTDEQMQTFAKKWFKDDTTKRDLFLEELAKNEHEGLRDLGRIPLLLTLLCLAFGETMHFPARRVEIYEEALEALLKKWDTSRNIIRDAIYRELSLGRKRQLFARIAAKTFEKGDYFLRQADLAQQIVNYLQLLPPADREEDIEGDVVLKAIEAQHGIFVERAHRIYSFSHLTFQEYFTAKYIANDANHRMLENLINPHFTEKRWREVFLFTISLLGQGNAENFFAIFKRAIDGLVANDETLVKFLGWADKKTKTVDTPYESAIVRSIYCSLNIALDIIRNVDRDLTYAVELAHTITFVLVLARDLVRDLAIDRDLVRDIYLVFEPPISRDLDLFRNLDLIRDFKIDFNLTFVLQFTLTFSQFKDQISKFINYFTEIVNLCQEEGLAELHHALINLTVPNQSDSQTAWEVFANELREVMQKHRDIGHEWNFTQEQQGCLKRYFDANRLLVKCLDLAVVSDREGIKESLLLLEKN
jgi:predicted NACHT family NTPase